MRAGADGKAVTPECAARSEPNHGHSSPLDDRRERTKTDY